MFKTFKEWLEEKGVSPEDYTAKSETEMAQLQKDYLQYVSETMKEKGVTTEAVQGIVEEATKSFITEESIKESQVFKDIDKRLKEAEEKAKQAVESIGKGQKAKQTTLAEAIKEEKDNVIALVKGTRSKSVILKAPVLRASIATNPSGYFLPDIGQLGHKNPGLYDVLPKVSVPDGNHQGVIRYVDWDEATIVRAAAVVAEGGTFPESTAAFKGYSKELIKVGDTLPVSDEFGTDEVSAAAELEMFLETNVKLKRDIELVTGAGTAGNIEGLYTGAPTFTAAASGIVAPNIYDLGKKVRTSIVAPRGSKYRPDILVINSVTADEFHLTKDANENYIFKDEGNVGPMIIVIDENMADNTMLVGDRRFARIFEKLGLELSRGLVDAQFVEDLETLKARIRFLLLVRTVDKTGFAKVTDIDAALTTLGT